VLLFDSRTFSARDQADALDAAFNDAAMPQSVSYVTGRAVRHRVELLELGPGIQLMRNTGTGLRITRSARHVRQAAPEVIAVGLPLRGQSLLAGHDGTTTVYAPGGIHLLDTTRPYEFLQSEVSGHQTLLIEAAQLWLPVDMVRTAAPALQASPFHDLVCSYLARLFEAAPEESAKAMAMTGRATAELVRALITTAAGDPRQSESSHSSLYLRITLFIDAQLHDGRLDACRIAAAHDISVRQLYNVWARSGNDLTLAQWIMKRRLERARNQLADPVPGRATIADVAHACGFATVSHFSQRFHAAYGITPRGWRESARQARAEAASLTQAAAD
jgi:AraC family transcriptional activator of tynA and feaB